uniref:Biotinidase n=1 Tax=Sparus aurata TaxID=8175 RepID=A0A671TK45_SPAAU
SRQAHTRQEIHLCSCADLWFNETPVADASYVAAVYEHNVILNPEPRVPLSRPAALTHLQRNLDVYEEQAGRAAQQGVQILVFPEDGLQGFNFTRSSISGYLETIPDPQQESWNPCTEPDTHNHTEVHITADVVTPLGCHSLRSAPTFGSESDSCVIVFHRFCRG